MECPAKIRPFPNDTELACDKTDPDHDEHQGVLRDYARPGSQTTLIWQDSDRRNFTGQWMECSDRGCVLPVGHHGGHAL